ncbi:unnamed protein product [Euphydryas editha]|uniref:DUF4817 domain-containing protein n=1 Tax=Euphydryas editha TaxID=104508 RepID=A0AAU9TZN9_EUPED|nr:unnamed protein product [Euphydryas editha]
MPRIQYTPQEYTNMHFIYGECRGNANAAAALYRERYPNLRHPDYRVFIRVHGCFSEGMIPGSGVGGASAGRPVISNDEEIVLDEIERDSSVSTRTLARHTGISKSRIQRILKKICFTLTISHACKLYNRETTTKDCFSANKCLRK